MQTVIDAKIGLINIFKADEIDTHIEKINTSLNGYILKPNTKTNLDDFFNGEVEYLGICNGYMQFKIGEDNDLFGATVWVNSFKKITDTRICTVYQAGTARDYNFKNGEWK